MITPQAAGSTNSSSSLVAAHPANAASHSLPYGVLFPMWRCAGGMHTASATAPPTPAQAAAACMSGLLCAGGCAPIGGGCAPSGACVDGTGLAVLCYAPMLAPQQAMAPWFSPLMPPFMGFRPLMAPMAPFAMPGGFVPLGPAGCGNRGPCPAGSFCDASGICRADTCKNQHRFGCPSDEGQLAAVACPAGSGWDECFTSSSGGFQCFRGPAGASVACSGSNGGSSYATFSTGGPAMVATRRPSPDGGSSSSSSAVAQTDAASGARTTTTTAQGGSGASAGAAGGAARSGPPAVPEVPITDTPGAAAGAQSTEDQQQQTPPRQPRRTPPGSGKTAPTGAGGASAGASPVLIQAGAPRRAL